jgi:NADPH:quinone reductase-like Zn-dependent oxidoreductase
MILNQMMFGDVRPVILGWDIAGTVEVGSKVSHFKVGDTVFGMINFLETVALMPNM